MPLVGGFSLPVDALSVDLEQDGGGVSRPSTAEGANPPHGYPDSMPPPRSALAGGHTVMRPDRSMFCRRNARALRHPRVHVAFTVPSVGARPPHL